MIVFDDMIADMISNNKTLSSSQLTVYQHLSHIYDTTILPSTKRCKTKNHTFFNIKIPNKKGLQEIDINYSFDIDSKEFTMLHRFDNTLEFSQR